MRVERPFVARISNKMKSLRVHLLPSLVSPQDLAGSRCVVIDVLRATTTIVTALAAGAQAVVPCLTIEEAQAAAAGLPGLAVLGGERGGVAIDGFDLGNSPAEYTPQRVGGKLVVLTTTNGTRALGHCHQAGEIVIASFLNRAAVCNHLAGRSRIEIVCAGTDGQVTREDVLLAGALVEGLNAATRWDTSDQAEIALDSWRAVAGADDTARRERLACAMQASRGGRNLIELGMQGDIELAAQTDISSLVPRFDPHRGMIVA